MSALCAAFSLRRNVRALLVPARGQLPALDGVRALAILWVISCHSIWSRGLGKYPRDFSLRPAPARSVLDHLPYIALATAASLVVATVFYLFVERPVMHLRPAGTRAAGAALRSDEDAPSTLAA